VLRKDIYQDCLVLYPAEAWNVELDLLRSKLNKYDEEQQQTFRQFVWESEVLDMDASGRILIPKRYLQMANIGSEVRFVGMNDTIEIWSRNKAEKPLMDADTFKANVRKFLVS
jgi:MraZ protein